MDLAGLQTKAMNATHAEHEPNRALSGPARQTSAFRGYAGNQTALRWLLQISPRLQQKLEIGAVNDPLEAEADRAADQVMRMPDPTLVPGSGDKGQVDPRGQERIELTPAATGAAPLQRKCACGGTGGECAACKGEREEGLLQMKSSGAPTPNEAPPIVHEVLRSPGQPLDPATLAFFEPRFGCDFSGVRVHSDNKASDSTRAVNAVGYTVGSDIVLDSRRYAAQTTAGRRLLAHELTHILQQSSGSGRRSQSQSLLPEQRSANEGVAQPAELRRENMPALVSSAKGCPSLQRWTYEESCDIPSILSDLAWANDRASESVQAAITALQVSPPNTVTQDLLFRFFGTRTNPDMIAAILNVYQVIASHLAAGDCDYDCSCQTCPDPGVDTGCSLPGEGSIIICVRAFQIGSGPETIIHEFSHRFAYTDDFMYCDAYSGCQGIRPDIALGNASSYGWFAEDLYARQTPSPTPPAPPMPGPPAPASSPTIYTVVSGDYLVKIAQLFYGDGTQWRKIYDANLAVIGSDPDAIFPGQVLTIPS